MTLELDRDHEGEAIRWLGRRTLTVRVVAGASGVCIAAAVFGVTWMVLIHDRSMPLKAAAIVAALAAAVPVAIAQWMSGVTVRAMLPLWIRAAAQRFDVEEHTLADVRAALR